jgi:nitrous oxidase accessory protein NosD
MLNRQESGRWVKVQSVIETLERRTFLAAHIAGNASVFATIQAAVDAASPGAVIDVDAGTYSENVQINKKLTLRGAQAGVDARSHTRIAGARETILNGTVIWDGSRSASFFIAADGVTLDGFVVQGETSKSLTSGAGVVIGPRVSGTKIYNNIIQNNVAGLFLSNYSSAQQAVIQHNVFRYNNNAGDNGGRGIYTDGGITGGNLTNVLIDGNTFISNFGGAGTTTYESAISLEARTAGSQSNVTISNNVFDDNGKSVMAYNANQVSVLNNVVTWSRDQWSAALRFEGGTSNVAIKGNTVYNNPGAALRVDSSGYPAGNTGFTVTGNNFYATDTAYNPRYALVVDDYSGTFDATGNYFGPGDGVLKNGNNVITSPAASAPIGNRQTPYYGLASNTGLLIQAEDFDHGGESIAYHDTDTYNSGQKDRQSGVDVESTTDAGGGFNVGWIQQSEWLEYTINVGSSGLYDLALRVASAAAGSLFHVEVDGANVTGAMTIPFTGGFQNWTTISKGGIAITSGEHVLKLVFDQNAPAGYVGNVNWMRLTNTVIVSPPAAPSALIAAAAGSTKLNLVWQDNSTNESGFIIERYTGLGPWTTLATVSAGVTSYSDATTRGGASYGYRVRATNVSGNSSYSNESWVTTPVASVTTYLSDLAFSGTPINAWGPVERDRSNGESGASDGGTITLNGVKYSKGLGVHARSEVSYNLNGAYSAFASDIGVDDETGQWGSIIFQLWGDGLKLFDSGVMLASSATKSVNVSVTGVKSLKLIVTDSGDDGDYDHGDWANARLMS